MSAATPATPQTNLPLKVVSLFVSVLGLAMVALPTAQTLARRLGTELTGATVVVQHLTLWLGFVGAALATATGKHLALSTSEAIPPRFRRVSSFITRAVTTMVCALLTVASYRVVLADSANSKMIIQGVPAIWSEAVMPIAFGLMALWTAFGPSWVAHQRQPMGWVEAAVGAASLLLTFALGFAAPNPVLIWALGIGLGVGFLLGSPVFVGLAGLAMVLFFKDLTPIAAVPGELFSLTTKSSLAAIPLLTIAGYVLAEGGAAKRLVKAYQGFFGWLPGGVALMATFVCAIFTTFTGGSGVTILALGGLLVPMLIEQKYPEGFSHGLVTSAGSLGLLFPPSLPVLLYAVVAEVPVEHLYLGGLVPGLLMMGLVGAWGVVVGVKHKVARVPFMAKDAGRGLWEAKWDLGLPLVVIVTVVTGFGTVVEAAALGCAYALIVEMAVFRTIHPVRDLPRVFATASTLVGSVIVLMGVATGLAAWFVDAEVPTRLLEWTQSHVKSPWVFLLALNVGLLLLGSVLEIYAAIVVLAPLVAPIGAAYGIDPVHLGVVFLANLELGFLFPPMGLNLFLASSRFQKPLPYFYARTLPFLLILAVGVLLITYLDFMTTGVVRLLK